MHSHDGACLLAGRSNRSFISLLAGHHLASKEKIRFGIAFLLANAVLAPDFVAVFEDAAPEVLARSVFACKIHPVWV
jgi:hypothetical protein